jgi:hypothetical protein
LDEKMNASADGAKSAANFRALWRVGSFLFVALLLVGCSAQSGISIKRGVPFTAMPARVVPLGDSQLVVFTAPSGGWQARFDTERPMFDGREVFVTITAPDPDMAHTRALVELRVLTPVSKDTSIDVYARVKPFRIENAEPGGLFGWFLPSKGEPPYYLAASVRPNE